MAHRGEGLRETRVAPELQQEIRQTQVSGLLSCVGQDGVELLGSILAFGRPHRRLGLVRQGFPSEYGVLVSSHPLTSVEFLP